MRTKLISLLTVCLVVVGFVACDVSGEQNYDFEVGETLAIVGPDSVIIESSETEVTVSYYSKAFTTDKDYKWTVSGAGTKDQVRREGEYIDIIFEKPSGGAVESTTIKVDDGEYKGEIEVGSREEI